MCQSHSKLDKRRVQPESSPPTLRDRMRPCNVVNGLDSKGRDLQESRNWTRKRSVTCADQLRDKRNNAKPTEQSCSANRTPTLDQVRQRQRLQWKEPVRA